MKRRVVLLLLLLVAGAIVNVAVAWTFGLRCAPATFASANFHQSHPDRPTWYYNLSRHRNHQWLVACAVPFADVGWAYVPSQTLSWSIVNERPPPQTGEYIPARDVGFWLEEGAGGRTSA